MQERLPAMAPKKKARLHPTLTTTVLNSTSQVSKLIRALDPQELADVIGTGLSLASLENKLRETLHEPHHVQTAHGAETRHHQQPAYGIQHSGVIGVVGNLT